MRIKISLTKFSLALFLTFTLIGGYGFACNNTSSKVRQLAKAEDDVAQGLLSTAKVVAEAKTNGTLTQEDVDFIKPLLKSVGESNKEAIKIAKTIPDIDNIPIDKQAQLVSIISYVSSTLTTLNEDGALRIKDQKKRLLFSALVLAMQTSVTSTINVLHLKGN